MERLTFKTPAVMSMGFLDTEECLLYRRLQAYEDTGLTPDEIKELVDLVEKITEQNLQFKWKLAERIQ
jgi:hypothetical protein